MKEFAMRIKTKIQEDLNRTDAPVTLCVDEWTSRSGNRYIGITAHTYWRSEQLEYSLALVPVTRIHLRATDIRCTAEKVATDFGIFSKVETVITDSASIMISAFTDTDCQWTWYPCACHLINNIIGCFLEIIDDFVEPIKRIQICVANRTTFKTFLEQERSHLTKIPSWVKVRWLSMCDMISAIVKLEPLIRKFARDEKITLPLDGFSNARDLNHLFIQVNNAFGTLESNEFGAISWFIPALTLLGSCISELPEKYNEAKEQYFQIEQKKWSSIMMQAKMVYFVAMRLNPMIDAINYATREELNDTDQFIISEIGDTLSISEIEPKGLTDWSMIRNKSQRKVRNEFQHYLSEPIGGVIAIQEFWETKSLQYPRLSQFAKKILSIPPSTANCERMFSQISYNIGLRTLSLICSSVEAITLIISNLRIFESIWDWEKVF